MKYFLYLITLLISLCAFPISASATVYYVDFTGAGGGTGLATTSPLTSLDAFAETARSVGDIAFVRRNRASTTNMSDLTFTTSGTRSTPLSISADYDNLWNDFATSSQTATLASGSTTVTMSASTTIITAGMWIYVEGDCNEIYNRKTFNTCEFAYEVQSVISSRLHLYFPYKGGQAGSGKNLRIMPSAPIRGLTTSDFQLVFSADTFWRLKGIHLRGTDTVGQITIGAGSGGIEISDMIFEGNGTSATGLSSGTNDGAVMTYVTKTRMLNHTLGVTSTSINATMRVRFSDLLINGNSAASSVGFNILGAQWNVQVDDGVFMNHALSDIRFIASFAVSESNLRLRNTSFYSTNIITSDAFPGFNYGHKIWLEDHQKSIGDNRYYLYGQTTGTQSLINSIVMSTTSQLRSGGGASSIFITPGNGMGTTTVFGYIPLFNYPIYTDTSSKTYSVYFMATATSAFTADPTTDELWIECEFWDFPTNGTSTRRIKKSTGTIDFNGSTAWQALSVTCQPTNAGILYLRGWYGKTKETTNSNYFYIDSTPVKS